MIIKRKGQYLVATIIVLIVFFNVRLVKAQQKLSIMSYNIHHGQDNTDKDHLNAMAAMIKKSGADIVGLQEVDSVCARSGNIDQAKILAKLTGMNYAFVRHLAFDGGAYGGALLSKYPITNVVNHRLPIISEIAGETRAFLTAEISTSSQNKWIIGVAHLDYRNAGSRITQAKQITDIFKASKYPAILLGDMNADPNSKEVAILLESFQDTQPSNFLTYPAVKPEKKIDYIFVDLSQKIIITEKEVIPVQYSDHLPIISTIE